MNALPLLHFHPVLERMSARPAIRLETLALLISLWFTLVCNQLFWSTLFAADKSGLATTSSFAGPLALALIALQFILLTLTLNRWIAKPVLALLIVATAFAAHTMQQYHVYLDPTMLRNILHTDLREARELFSWNMLPPLAFYALPPLLLVWRCRIVRTPLARAAAFRLASVTLAAVVMIGATLSIFQGFSALMRENKELRYLVTPVNYLYSLGRALSGDASASTVKQPIGEDAHLGASWQARQKPVLLVLVVGETARAANWGLSGYTRQTTPELANREVINFREVTACGSNTEVSVPCMFSPGGRHNYDEARIRGSESLLHVLRRAGFQVAWLDNQSGCKGVCSGLETWRPDQKKYAGQCGSDGCLDEALLGGLREYTENLKQNTVLVLHMLGNHGPAYAKRYPRAFERYTPACKQADLGSCTREEIVNAYDNALLYTDHILASAIDLLRQKQQTFDTALLYLSDHGESLGENGLFLHGVPYAIAPREQTRVPMTLWLSGGYAGSFGLDRRCLHQRAEKPASHDHLFHTVLGLLDVQTREKDAAFDLGFLCKNSALAINSKS